MPIYANEHLCLEHLSLWNYLFDSYFYENLIDLVYFCFLFLRYVIESFSFLYFLPKPSWDVSCTSCVVLVIGKNKTPFDLDLIYSFILLAVIHPAPRPDSCRVKLRTFNSPLSLVG